MILGSAPISHALPPYRIRDLGPVVPTGTTPPTASAAWYFQEANGQTAGTLGISDEGDVVGTYLLNGVPRPFIHLRTAKFGLTSGFHDLLTEAGYGAMTPGYANDIANTASGVATVAGGVGGVAEATSPECRATTFVLATSGVSVVAQDNGAGGLWSCALGAEESMSGRVVGLVAPSCQYWWQAAEFAGAPTPLPVVLPLDDPMTADYVSLRVFATGSDPSFGTVGQFNLPTSDDDPACLDPGPLGDVICFNDHFCGWLLDPNQSTHYYRGESGMSQDVRRQLTVTRSMNGQGRAFGAMQLPGLHPLEIEPIPGTCHFEPCYWPPSAATDIVGIALPFPPLDPENPDDWGVAEAATSTSDACRPIRAVGWRFRMNLEIGWIWEETDVGWCATRFQDYSIPAPADRLCLPSGLTITQPFDINEHGHVAALAFGTNLIHAAYLTHRSDISGDGMVDAADLAILLGDWGSCVAEAGSPCRSDLDTDGDVDAPDFAVLLGDWQGSTAAFIETPCSRRTCLGVELDAPSVIDPELELILAIGGFGSHASFVEWATVTAPDELNATCDNMASAAKSILHGDDPPCN